MPLLSLKASSLNDFSCWFCCCWQGGAVWYGWQHDQPVLRPCRQGNEAHLQQSSSGKNGQGRLLGDQNSIVLFSFFFFFCCTNKSGMIVTLLLVRDRSLSLHGHFDPCRKSEVWWHRHTKERWKFFRRTVTCYGRWALSYVFPPVCKTRHCSSYPNVPQFHFMADSCVCKLQLWGSTK